MVVAHVWGWRHNTEISLTTLPCLHGSSLTSSVMLHVLCLDNLNGTTTLSVWSRKRCYQNL